MPQPPRALLILTLLALLAGMLPPAGGPARAAARPVLANPAPEPAASAPDAGAPAAQAPAPAPRVPVDSTPAPASQAPVAATPSSAAPAPLGAAAEAALQSTLPTGAGDLLIPTWGTPAAGGDSGVWHYHAGTWTIKKTGLPANIYWYWLAADPFDPNRWLLLGNSTDQSTSEAFRAGAPCGSRTPRALPARASRSSGLSGARPPIRSKPRYQVATPGPPMHRTPADR